MSPTWGSGESGGGGGAGGGGGGSGMDHVWGGGFGSSWGSTASGPVAAPAPAPAFPGARDDGHIEHAAMAAAAYSNAYAHHVQAMYGANGAAPPPVPAPAPGHALAGGVGGMDGAHGGYVPGFSAHLGQSHHAAPAHAHTHTHHHHHHGAPAAPRVRVDSVSADGVVSSGAFPGGPVGGGAGQFHISAAARRPHASPPPPPPPVHNAVGAVAKATFSSAMHGNGVDLSTVHPDLLKRWGVEATGRTPSGYSNGSNHSGRSSMMTGTHTGHARDLLTGWGSERSVVTVDSVNWSVSSKESVDMARAHPSLKSIFGADPAVPNSMVASGAERRLLNRGVASQQSLLDGDVDMLR